MRTPRNDRLSETGRAGKRGSHVPERRCVVTGEVSSAERLVRLALGPDGSIAPDVHGKAPGRGAWIGVDRATMEAAQAKGKLKGGLARALHDSDFTIPDDLGARIEAQWRARRSPAGANRAGNAERQREDRDAARRGVRLLLHASDAGGRVKTGAGRRVGEDAEGSGAKAGLAGGPYAYHGIGPRECGASGVTDARAAPGAGALSRWQFFTGWSRDADRAIPIRRPREEWGRRR